MEFPESFFKTEVRCGFEIEEMMKRAWAAEMEVLAEIIRICRKYGITYYASSGTLLGAVRHGGFIPWDDDIDIELKWKDYQRLLAVLPKELPKGWVVWSVYHQNDFNYPFSSVRNSWKICMEPEFLERFYGCPYVVGVDIFPLTFIPRDETLAETQRLLYNAVYDAAFRYPELEQSGELEQYLPQLEELGRVKLDRSKPLRRQLWLLADKICDMFCEEECDELTWFWYTVTIDPHYRFQKEWYADTIELPFETMQITAPKGYDRILTTIFGDYMTPKQMPADHEYPFYKEQQKWIEERVWNCQKIF